jgi:hypothetical protein
MKSFFEFYEKLKSKKLNENMGMQMPGQPMMAPPGGNMGAPQMGGGMAPPPMGGDMAAPDMGGGDMDMSSGEAETDAAPNATQRNTSAPEGDSKKPEEIYDMLDQISNFIKNAAGKDGEEEVDPQLKSEMESTLDSLKANLETLTGISAPSSSEDGAEEMGAEQPDEKGVGIDDASPQELDAGGAPSGGAPAGGNLFPSQAGGSGDMGMGGGSAPMGNPGGGGGMFGM